MKRSLWSAAIRFSTLFLAFVGVLSQLVPNAYAATVTLVAKLVGSNESPPTGSPGTGQAAVVLNPALNTMNVAATFGGLQSGTTASHIHCCLALPFQSGVNVGVATTSPTFPGFPLGWTSGSYSRSFNLLDAGTYNPAFVTSTIAGARDALVAGLVSGETYFNIHTTLFPGGEIRGFVTPVSGEAATGAQQAAFQTMNQFLGLMLDPFVGGRSGFGSAGGGAMAYAPDAKDLPRDVAAAYAAITKAPVAKPAPFEQRWTVWGGAYGGVNHTNGDPIVAGTHNLTSSVFGGAAGADYRLSPDTVLGFALAGGGTNWDIAQAIGRGRSDVFQAGVYGTTRFGAAYFAASFGFAEHWMSTNRTTLTLDHFTADFDGQSYGGRAEIGYRYSAPIFAFTPYAAVQAQAFVMPAYSEQDPTGTGFGFAFASRAATDTRSELGSRFDRAVAL